MLSKMMKIILAVFLSVMALQGVSWLISISKEEEQKLAARHAEEGALADERARMEAHASLIAMNRDDFRLAGQKCVDRISQSLNEDNSYDWTFVDLDPHDFTSIKNSRLMGLRATAIGSESTGSDLVSAQIDEVIASIREDSGYASMSFVISERMDSFTGLMEVLQLRKCSFSTKDSVSLHESDRFVLN